MRCPWCQEVAGPDTRCMACRRQLRPERRVPRGLRVISLRRRVTAGLTGLVLDGYQVTGPLGEGQTHDVYVASEVATGWTYALKVRRRSWDPADREAATRDYAILRALDDPHLAGIHDVNLDSDTPYVVLELVEADPLISVLPIEWRRTLDLIRQMCAPLHAAAERGLIYRKLSLEKVFLEPRAAAPDDPYRGVAESGDFIKLVMGTNVGTAAYRLDNPTEVGAVEYLAPELLTGAGDERSYVFTLGVFAYFLITGRLPFRSLTVTSRIVTADEPIAPPGTLVELPPAVDAAIMTCLATAPAARFPTTLALREQLTALLG